MSGAGAGADADAAWVSELVRVGESETGGGRGVFASQDIRAGTLLIEEEPYVFPAGDGVRPLHVHIAEHLLRTGDDAAFGELHPQSLDVLGPEERAAGEGQHGERADAMVAGSGEFAHLDRDTVLRTLLAVQFNAFDSGLYHVQSMVNHGCSPNATKSTPPGLSCSRIVACQDIKSGQEITIHYAAPVERSWEYRASTLRQQHYFALGPSPFGDQLDGPLDKAQGECARDLEARMDEGGDNSLDAALAILDAAHEGLPVSHLVTTRAYKGLLTALLSALSTAPDVTLALTVLATVLEIQTRQAQYLGPDHLDVAATWEDLEHILSFLLSHDPDALFASYPNVYGSFRTASKSESVAKKHKNRIRRLYDPPSN